MRQIRPYFQSMGKQPGEESGTQGTLIRAQQVGYPEPPIRIPGIKCQGIAVPDWCWILTAVSPRRADIPSHIICWIRENCSTFTVKPSSTFPTRHRQTWKTERVMATQAWEQRKKSRRKTNLELPSGWTWQANTWAPFCASPERHQRHLANTSAALWMYQDKNRSHLTHQKNTERTEKKQKKMNQQSASQYLQALQIQRI